MKLFTYIASHGIDAGIARARMVSRPLGSVGVPMVGRNTMDLVHSSWTGGHFPNRQIDLDCGPRENIGRVLEESMGTRH